MTSVYKIYTNLYKSTHICASLSSSFSSFLSVAPFCKARHGTRIERRACADFPIFLSFFTFWAFCTQKVLHFWYINWNILIPSGYTLYIFFFLDFSCYSSPPISCPVSPLVARKEIEDFVVEIRLDETRS